MTKKLKGFTLIELLIVMAILGVLAVVVLVAINPVQQLARTRDAGRKSGVAQIGRALEAYYTSHSGTYVPESVDWTSVLVSAGEISTVPSAIAYGGGFTAAGCGTDGFAEEQWCYNATDADGAEPAVVYTELESDSEVSKCDVSPAWFVWSTADGRGGLVCHGDLPAGADAPVPGNQNWNALQ